MYRIILAAALAAQASFGATYVVAPGGNDSNPGSASAPFRTIGKGVAVARAGDIVQVRAGTYVESVTINQSGTAAAPIRIQAYPGETPVLDGQNKIPGQWYGLIYVNGAHVEVSGFELKNSAQRGLVLYGHHGSARRMDVHDSRENGVLIEGDDCLVEDSRVYRNALSNLNGAGGGMWSGGLNAARGADGIASRNVIRRNVVYGNWGEGLSTFEADGTVIEDNVIYDNFSVNLYVSDARNAVAQRNLIYNTAAAPLRNGNPASGITLADEVASKPRSYGNRIINNLLKDVPLCAFCWTGVAGSKLDGALIAHNTLVNGTLQVGQTAGNTRVVNNLTGAQVVGGTSISPEYFRLKERAQVAKIAEVPTDWFGTARPNPATAGAIEYAAATVPPPTPDPVYPAFSINIYRAGSQVQQVPVSGDEIRIIAK